jgi:Ca2+-transporting ATPase
MAANIYNTQGLTDAQVLAAREKFGANQLTYKKRNRFLEAVVGLIKEPMIILLLVTSSIYFISGKVGDGIFLASAIVLVSLISLYQDSKSRDALDKLKDFTKPNCKVIRNGAAVQIKSEEVVVGDSLLVEEGILIGADGTITHSNDFSVNESILTGESMPVAKDSSKEEHSIFSGTTVTAGLAIATVTAIGNETRLGKIGKSLESIKEEPTPLERQINNFVKKMVVAGAIVFVIVWIINYIHSKLLLDSLIKSLTLAMSVLPEEIPMALTSFMALGAWRLMKMGIVVKQMKTVETLGSATVICTDKTGTITENKMSLAKVYLIDSQKILNADELKDKEENELIRVAMFASEPIPFDPMEVALHDAYKSHMTNDERTDSKLVHEYPLGGKPPMMTHVFQNSAGVKIIAAKGAPEAIINVSPLDDERKTKINDAIKTLSLDGYRLLAVGETSWNDNNYPATQQEFKFNFKGLVAFYDPPKKNIQSVLASFYKAGIQVKIITGDNAETTSAIAKQIGFKGFDKTISGDELMKLNEEELKQRVEDTQIFTRMFPEAKLKIINALKAKNEIVAMTGDGVNDGPALKAAHIGIAMGKKGTEIAKQAASLILLEDDLSKMVDAIAMGRKIYTNLKKAIQYIISIHIPIILTVFIPLALGWVYPNIFLPVHIIFLELIMGPTCSIIYENEPMEANAMSQKPRPFTSTFFKVRELIASIIQGLVITVGTLGVYQYGVYVGLNEASTRTLVFTNLIVANIFLMLVNRSFYYSMLSTLRYKNNLVLLMIVITVALTSALLFIQPLSAFFDFELITLGQLAVSAGVGIIATVWFEAVKWVKRRKGESMLKTKD